MPFFRGSLTSARPLNRLMVGALLLIGCKPDPQAELAADMRRFDSARAHGDTALQRRKREQDSLIAELQNAATGGVPLPAGVSFGSTATTMRTAADTVTPGRMSTTDRMVAVISDSLAVARALAAEGPYDSALVKKRVASNALQQRAEAKGDSMAKAAAQKYAGNMYAASSSADTVRGTVVMVGKPPALNPGLRIARTNATIALTGMANEGLHNLAGAEVMVRGMKVGPRDLVVRNYVVRAMNGVPAYDGKLESDAGGWSLRLTDGTGRKRLGSVPEALRLVVGARVWISMPVGSSTPKAYGLVAQR